MPKITQLQMILDYIEEHGSITHLEASRNLGVQRLAARVSDLKKQGYGIKGEMVKVKNRNNEFCHVKKYYLGESS